MLVKPGTDGFYAPSKGCGKHLPQFPRHSLTDSSLVSSSKIVNKQWLFLNTHLELLPEFDVDYLGRGSFVIPCTHLINVGGRPCVRDAENLPSQTSNKRHRGAVHGPVAWNGNGCRLVH